MAETTSNTPEPSEREEAPERLTEIRERYENSCDAINQQREPDYNLSTYLSDIDFLLSLLDSQAERSYAERTPIGIQIANNAALRMRERCVARLRQIAADYDNQHHQNTGAMISKQAILYGARQLESLTLDGEKEQ